MISAIIMAAGFGKRMGKNKLLLPYKNKTMVEHIIEKVMNCGFYDKVLVARDESVLSLGKEKGIKTIKNHNAHKGQSESIKIGINALEKAEGYMFFAADQPLLDIETIRLLMNTFEKNKNSIVVPVYSSHKGNPVIFPERFINKFKLLEGDKGGKSIINNHISDVVFTEVKNKYVLMDIDTKEDYDEVKLSIKG